MVAKVILSDDEVKKVIKEVLSDYEGLVQHTLGPLGRPSLVAPLVGSPQLVDDGRVILTNMGYKDTAHDSISRLITDAIEVVNDKVGDSSTTNMILTSVVTKACLEATSNPNINPFGIKEGLEKGLSLCKEFLNKVTKEVKPTDIYRLAYVCSNSKEIATLIANTVGQVGMDSGFIHVTESKGTSTYVEMSGGLEIEAGCASPTILSAKGTKELSLEKPYILIADQPINNPGDIIPILEAVSRNNNPLIIFADKFSNDVLATLTLNTVRGICTAIPVQLPLYDRNELLKDISAISGGDGLVISPTSGVSIKDFDIRKGIGIRQIAGGIIYKDKVRLITTLPNGEYDNSNNAVLIARSLELQAEEEEALKKGDTERVIACRKRLAAMNGGIATIYVAAPTEVAMNYSIEKMKDCISSITSATRKGVIPLASSSMIYMALYLEAWIKNNSNKISSNEDWRESYIKGIQILSDALKKPLEIMVSNRGEKFYPLYKQFKELFKKEKWSYGFDVISLNIMDLLQEGEQLIDSSLALEEVLINVVSLSSMLMLTKGGAVEVPIEEQKMEHITMM